MPDSRSRRPRPLDSVVQQGDQLLFERIRRRAEDLAPVVRVWRQVLPEPLVDHVRPVLLHQRRLGVWADSPVWNHNLRHSSPSLIARLHEFGVTGVDEIESRLAPVDLPRPTPTEPAGPGTKHRGTGNTDVADALSRLRQALDQPD